MLKLTILDTKFVACTLNHLLLLFPVYNKGFVNSVAGLFYLSNLTHSFSSCRVNSVILSYLFNIYLFIYSPGFIEGVIYLSCVILFGRFSYSSF